ncbi:MAG: extracellular solute-binding protein, partial [Patescibacteria group bacterium]
MNTRFQVIVTLIFSFFIVVGVIIFSTSRGSSTRPENNITVWGILPESSFSTLLRDYPIGKDKEFIITYVQKRAATFDQEFIGALAENKGPDIIFLPHDSMWKHQNKIFPISYQTFSERKFKDTFVEEGELYLTSGGILGLPILVDPLVMYWNRDMFSNASISKAPEYWDEFFDLAQKLTKKDQSFNITESGVSLGEFRNVNNAKEILSALIMQAGSSITARTDNAVTVVLNERMGQAVIPAEAAVNFYTEFSNPIKLFYSWNRSLPRSDNFFTGGDLGIYFGFASEFSQIKEKNPNINFDVAPFPQSRESKTKITYGSMQALSVVKNSKNIVAAIQVALALTDRERSAAVSTLAKLPPVRRDLLSQTPSDAYNILFWEGALRSRAWIDPDSTATENIMLNMIESITAGRLRTSQAISRAHAEI